MAHRRESLTEFGICPAGIPDFANSPWMLGVLLLMAGSRPVQDKASI